MAGQDTDIVIYGAGIAGLWMLHHLRGLGYNVLLLETHAIGGVQTIASQGIIHSGLKYTLTGGLNPLARSISAMPQRWRDFLQGDCIAAESQQLLIPKGFVGGLVKIAAMKALGNTRLMPVPRDLQATGFDGSLVHMDEPVLDVPALIRKLAQPHENYIRKAGTDIKAKVYIHASGHGGPFPVQARPLLMGMIRNAPFPLFAHLVGASDKPVATVTTHRDHNGALVWYIGGLVAERAKEADPRAVHDAMLAAVAKYMPEVNISGLDWSVLPVDRIEAKAGTAGWMPDSPVIQADGNNLYCWPTKLTFAPLLGDMMEARLREMGIAPSNTTETGWSNLPALPYAETPWNLASWNKENSAVRA